MSRITLWSWEKKKRTMLRYIKAGDIFCFLYDEGKYCFGRVISRLNIGAPVEIFDYVFDSPSITEEQIENANRMFRPVVLDLYMLFDKKMMGDWRIIGHQSDFEPIDVENTFFTFGIAPHQKIDVYGNTTVISANEASAIPEFVKLHEFHIKIFINLKKGKISADNEKAIEVLRNLQLKI